MSFRAVQLDKDPLNSVSAVIMLSFEGSLLLILFLLSQAYKAIETEVEAFNIHDLVAGKHALKR